MKILILIALFFCACGDGNFDFSDQSQNIGDNSNNILIREPNEGVPGASDSIMSPIMTGSWPDCSEVMGIDGDDGFLFKPVSDSDGKAVVLLPSEFQTKFQSVQIKLLDGSLEEGVFTGFANGNRQHWRFSMSGENYLGTIFAIRSDGNCVWRIENTSIRQD